MKRMLVLDLWHGVSGGASKSSLYRELSRFFELLFCRVKLPISYHILPFVKGFHPSRKRWAERAGSIREAMYKHPATFRAVSGLFDDAARQYRYDLIFQIGSLFGPIARERDIPYFSYHDSTVKNAHTMWKQWLPQDFEAYEKEWYDLERAFFSSMTGIFTYSNFARETVVKDYGIEPEKVVVVGSALKIPEEYPVNWTERKKTVLFVSTDFERKGGYTLAEIFERVVKEIPDATLLVVGRVPERFERMERPWLKKLGPLGRKELIEVYKKASILLHPAIYDPFPSVILEAGNFEIPCVGSSTCGIPEMVIDGVTGYLVSPGDIQGFAERIVELLKDRDLLVGMGQKAKEFVRENYHPEVVASNIKRAIERFV